MQEINIIQLPFYQWTLPDSLVESCNEFVSGLDFHLNGDVASTGVFDFVPLTEYVSNACKELQSKIYPNQNNFVILPTIFWANKTEFLGKHHRHAHSNSLFSGIIYLTDNEKSGATRFYFPDIFKYYETKLFNFSEFSKKDNHYDFFPEKGKMIIFPSNIEHETIPNKKSSRVSIAFNTFIKGDIGSTDTKTFLTL